jgi:sec-independent protein translocase protein TatA
MIGSQDVIIGVVLVVILFGAKRLPELASSLGKSMKEFRKATTEADAPEPAPARPAPLAAAPSRSCGSCQAPLETEWTHCPRCGTAAPAPTAPTGVRP